MTQTATLAGLAVGDGHPVRIMAALNVSPESFFPGSVYAEPRALREAAVRAVAEGADLIDLGAMSTAPYLDTRISIAEETARLVRAIEAVRAVVDVPISADTTRAPVAAAALAAGACIVNDVTGLRGDPAMADVAAQAEGVVLTASDEAADRDETDPLALVTRRLGESLRRAAAAGIAPERIVLDPGIGFFTRTRVPAPEFSCRVLAGLAQLRALGRPLVVGVSRKSFIGRLTGRDDPAARLAGSLAATAVAVYHGAAVVRTHDVAATRDAVRVAEALRASAARPSRGSG